MDRAVQRRLFWYRRLAWIVLAVAVVRGLVVVAADPLLAIANNYDQIRVQACLGAYPDRDPSIAPVANSPQAPYARFRFMPEVDAPCSLTSELLFAWAAWPAMQVEQRLRADHSFSVRWKGGLQFVLWAGLIVWCTRRLIRLDRADLALGHAVLCAVAIADPANFLYLNTFYGEASAILFCHALLAGIVVVLAQSTRPRRIQLIAIALTAFLLATSKIQHLIVPILVWLAIACCALAARTPRTGLLTALAFGAIAGAAGQALHMGNASNESIRLANLVDTLFTAMLPNASNPQALLARLELPRECIEQSGKSWYSPGMANREHCPRAFELHHRDLLQATLEDPPMVVHMLQGGMAYASPWIPSHLGVVEGQVRGGLPAWAPSANTLIFAPGQALPGLMAGLPILALILVFLRRRACQFAANAILLSLATLPFCIYVTSVFGDGYVDLSKHIQLGIACLLAALTVFSCLLIDGIASGGRTDGIQ